MIISMANYRIKDNSINLYSQFLVQKCQEASGKPCFFERGWFAD